MTDSEIFLQAPEVVRYIAGTILCDLSASPARP